jgi:hypothetical protein
VQGKKSTSGTAPGAAAHLTCHQRCYVCQNHINKKAQLETAIPRKVKEKERNHFGTEHRKTVSATNKKAKSMGIRKAVQRLPKTQARSEVMNYSTVRHPSLQNMNCPLEPWKFSPSLLQAVATKR